EENKLGQRFGVDLDLFLSLKKAGSTDDVNDTINYAEVYELTKEIVEKEKYRLVETVADQIAKRMLSNFPLLEQIRVGVIKPNPPIAGHYDQVAVEIIRVREHSCD
ncbi:MAG: dihydroneopterin aldolase, partial [Bacilli bacterium]